MSVNVSESGWFMVRVVARNLEIECVTFLSSAEYIMLRDHLGIDFACSGVCDCTCCVCAIGGSASIEEINAIDWKFDTSLNAQFVMRILQKMYDYADDDAQMS